MKINPVWGILIFGFCALPGLTKLQSLGKYDLNSPQGEVTTLSGGEKGLRIVNRASKPQAILLLTISQTRLQSPRYLAG